jgi:hypothetical protein
VATLPIRVATSREDDVMRMGEMEIHEYARQLLEAHGETAVVEAAQKACSCQERGQTEEAETWRHIEAVLKQMRGLHMKLTRFTEFIRWR